MLKRILAIPMAVVLVGMFISVSNVPVPDESMKAVQETIEKDQKNTKENEETAASETNQVVEEKTAEKKEVSSSNTSVDNSSKKVENSSKQVSSSSTSSSSSVPTKIEESKPTDNSIPSTPAPTPKPTQPEKPKEEKPISYNYQIGNSGKLYTDENVAYSEAERYSDNYVSDTNYVSGYLVYSTYDKWTISYYYSNY